MCYNELALTGRICALQKGFEFAALHNAHNRNTYFAGNLWLINTKSYLITAEIVSTSRFIHL